jgi:hypothetical protein
MLIKKSEIGSFLAVFVYVFTQFFQADLFVVSGLVISVQKILAFVAFPLVIILISVKIHKSLVVLASSLFVTYTLAYFTELGIRLEIVSVAFVILSGLSGAIILYSALTKVEIAIVWFAKTWIVFAVVTSFVSLLQSMGLFPFLTLPEGNIVYRETGLGFYRGVGFKYDPNFQALMLVIGFLFTQLFVHKRVTKVIYTIVIILGVIATFSRMGILLVGLTFVTIPLVENVVRKKNIVNLFVRILCTIILITVIGYAVYALSSEGIRAYLRLRFTDIYSGWMVLVKGVHPGGHISSAEERAILYRAAWVLGLKNWPTGVGAFQTYQVLNSFTGTGNVSHSTYTELFLIGGLFGVITILYYGFVVVANLFNYMKNNYSGFYFERKASYAIAIVLAASALVLSLTYNSIFWLPIVMVLSTRFWIQMKNANIN